MTTGEDRAYTFTAADFGFMDADAGAALASVKIVTTPAAGILALDGTAVVALDDVTKVQIDGDMLTFRPALNAHGVAYTTFTFKVNDGTDDSASAYTMTIDVTDSPAPVCTAPSFGDRRQIWTGTVTVETLILFSRVRLHGFDALSTFGVNAGALDTPTFNIGSNAYTVDQAFVNPAGDLGGDLQFTLNDDLSGAEYDALRLHVCDTSYDFSATGSLGSFYTWPDDLDWSHPVVTRTLYLSLPANNVATGDPTITGTAQVGQELTADASPIADDDGLTDVDFTYQWLQVDADGTSNEEDITGEIAATYTLATDDEGKKIKVQVSFTDELSGVEMRTSAATVTVTAAGTTNNAPTAANNTVTTGEDRPYTFTAADFSFMDADAGAALASVKIVTVPAAGTLALDGTAVVALDDVTKAQIDGGMLTFRPALNADGDAYTTFTFKVNDGTDDSASAYTMTIDVTDSPAPVCTAPSFGDRREIWTGTVTVETLIRFGAVRLHGFDALPTFGVNAGALDPPTFNIGSNAYTVNQAFVYPAGDLDGDLQFSFNDSLSDAKHDALRLHVCDTPFDFSAGSPSAGAYSWTADLDWSHPVVTRTLYLSLPANNVATGEPAITGTAQVGQDLTADESPIMDDDGLPSSFTYKWFRVDSDGTSNEAEISGEIATTYTLATDDEGKKIKVQVSFTDELSGVEMRTSAAYPSSGTVTTASTNTAPMVTDVDVTSMPASAGDTYGIGEMILFTVTFDQNVTVTGTPEFEFCLGSSSTMSCSAGMPPPALRSAAYVSGSGTTMLVFSYTVVAGDMDDDGIWIGDQSDTLKLDAADTIEGTMGGLTAVLTHAEEGPQTGHKVDGAAGNIPATGAPTITGTAQVGQTLTASITGIADANGLTSATYMYQWIRANGTEANITSANSSTYALVAADLGKTIKVKVSFTDDASNTETLTSAATATVTAATVTPVSSGLVSNVGQSESDSFGLAANDFAQSFTTGTNPTGYTLTSIELRLSAFVSTVTPTVKLYSGSADGTEVATLTGPAMLDAGTIKNYTFTPSSTSTALLASTPYWVVAEGDAYWVSTTSTSEDATPATGWSIANNYESRHASSTGSFTTFTGFAFKNPRQRHYWWHHPDEHRPDGGQQHGDDGRGHGVHLRGGRLRLRRHGRRRRAGERDDRDPADAGHAGARRHGCDAQAGRHQGPDRRKHAHLHARGRCERRPLYDLHFHGERRHGRQRQRLHDDHRRDGRRRQHPRDGRADHHGHGAGGQDADGGHHRHHGCGRADQRHLHVPVDSGEQHGGRHYEREFEHLPPGRRRPGQDHQGQGELHRRRQQHRDADQRGDGDGDRGHRHSCVFWAGEQCRAERV